MVSDPLRSEIQDANNGAAGQRLEDAMGSRTSCYVGCFTHDYSDMTSFGGGDVPLYHGTGTGLAMMSNRVSWYFNFKGPSISLDTACSSSLVALHLGCQSLRTGESDMVSDAFPCR